MAASQIKTAHVNMMTDTVIANLPPDGLKSVIRGILANAPEVTSLFEEQTRSFLRKAKLESLEPIHTIEKTQELSLSDSFLNAQSRVRCMLGCELCYDSLPIIRNMVDKLAELDWSQFTENQTKLLMGLETVDGDIVQAVTAVQKTLFNIHGSRKLREGERKPLEELLDSLTACRTKVVEAGRTFPFRRGLSSLADLLTPEQIKSRGMEPTIGLLKKKLDWPPAGIETFEVKGFKLPRIFCGLWQLSSPAWGSASQSNIINQFLEHVHSGLWAFDMADHYGDAELLFGKFRNSYEDPGAVFGTTKYCVFHHMTVTREAIHANVTERCQRLDADHINLLQFHWQFYDDPHYVEALRYLQEDDRLSALGLCNFDTEHMEVVLQNGIEIVSNQVQFSLIDSRPTVKMGKACEEHGVKLLTYGTLCGGFLADKWLDQPEPELFLDTITPSQRKYYGMICSWGGWTLFQELLHTLKTIADKHHVSISNVATRWVLDFPYVGAVIVGVRMGVSEHAAENLASFGWHLDQDDQEAIEKVLQKSLRMEVFESMGDCGGEYR